MELNEVKSYKKTSKEIFCGDFCLLYRLEMMQEILNFLTFFGDICQKNNQNVCKNVKGWSDKTGILFQLNLDLVLSESLENKKNGQHFGQNFYSELIFMWKSQAFLGRIVHIKFSRQVNSGKIPEKPDCHGLIRIFEFGLFWTEIFNKKILRQNSMKVYTMVDPERNLKNLKFSLVVFHGKFCKMMITFGNLPPNLDMPGWVQNCKTSHKINF